MRQFTQDWQVGHLRMMLNNVRRRRAWFMEGASPAQMANLALAGAHFACKAEYMRAWPVVAKVDISPLCNLRCTYCVHAVPGEGSDPALQQQVFRRSQQMQTGEFEGIARQIAGKTMAVSLYYLGDPLMHPQLDEICGIASSARLNCHVSTNFSFDLTDERLTSLLTSGLTHLTVCVDGLRQESYERTRVGGRIERVLDNLDRTLRIRSELGTRYPRIEVQFIRFQHNLDQLADAEHWCRERGVDQFTDYWGNLHNYTDEAPGRYRVFGPKANRALPQCSWPHFALQVRYDGDVIPCCYFRHAEQYRPAGDRRVIGNVLETSVWEVWNSAEYRALRRLVSNPARSSSEPSLGETFCDGCPTVFDTDIASKSYTADKHAWEELYVRDDRNVVTRAAERPGARPGETPAVRSAAS
jgi:MoaA/NifB/PqqE/SkfB family radical SAM enzyme